MRESDIWPALRAYWHPVALSADLKDEKPLAVQLLNERLAVCRLKGQVKAYHDLCIHRGTPLSLGWVEGENLVCAYHGWAYNGDGTCVRIRRSPRSTRSPRRLSDALPGPGTIRSGVGLPFG